MSGRPYTQAPDIGCGFPIHASSLGMPLSSGVAMRLEGRPIAGLTITMLGLYWPVPQVQSRCLGVLAGRDHPQRLAIPG